MIDIILILLLLFVSAFFSGSETGAYSVNRLRLMSRVRGKNPDLSARILNKLLSDRQTLVSTILVGNNLVNYLASAVCVSMLMKTELRPAALWSTIILSPFVLVFGEIIPKTLFVRHANAIMYRIAFIIRATTFIFYPAVMLLKGIMIVFDRFFGEAEQRGIGAVSAQRLRHFLEEGRQEGVLSPQQSRMAENVMKLEKIPLSHVMVPLNKVFAVPADIERDDLKKNMREHSYSRLPVFEGKRDNITGVLVLLEYLCSEERAEPKDFIRPAKKLDSSMPIDAALLELRRNREPMGIVINRQGRAIGIVTIKDLVEEIVGELAAW